MTADHKDMKILVSTAFVIMFVYIFVTIVLTAKKVGSSCLVIESYFLNFSKHTVLLKKHRMVLFT